MVYLTNDHYIGLSKPTQELIYTFNISINGTNYNEKSNLGNMFIEEFANSILPNNNEITTTKPTFKWTPISFFIMLFIKYKLLIQIIIVFRIENILIKLV